MQEMLPDLGPLCSGEVAPIGGVYKGFHTNCGRNNFHLMTPAGLTLPFCVDCGWIGYALFALAPGEEHPENRDGLVENPVTEK